MRTALLIAGKDLRQRVRDRSALVLGFVAPLAIAALMSAAFGDADEFHLDLGVVDEDGGPLADAFSELLSSPGLAEIVTVEAYDSVAAAEEAVEDDEVGAAVVLPRGFSDAVDGEAPLGLEVLASVDGELSASVATAITESFVAQVNANRLSVATAVAAGAPLADVAELAAAVGELRLPATVAERPTGDRPLEAISYYGPSMAIFFLLFAVAFGARSFFAERRDGTLDRIAAAPTRPAAILAGKALSVLAYGTASMATVAVVTSLVFGARWGDPLAVAVVVAAMVLAVVALTALVIAVSRTERQADAFASIVVFALALLGGNFVFVSQAPGLLRRLALLTPNGWALRAFTDLSTGGGGLGDVLVPVGAILAFTAAVGVVAALASRRLVVR